MGNAAHFSFKTHLPIIFLFVCLTLLGAFVVLAIPSDHQGLDTAICAVVVEFLATLEIWIWCMSKVASIPRCAIDYLGSIAGSLQRIVGQHDGAVEGVDDLSMV